MTLSWALSGTRRDFGVTLGADQIGLPCRNAVKIIRLNEATRQDVNPAKDISARHLRVTCSLYPADEALVDADFTCDSRLRPPMVLPPLRKLHRYSPYAARRGLTGPVQEYDGVTYLVNGHGNIAGSYYAPVAYIYVMHPGNRLRVLRKAAGLTQAELAERTGFGQDRISNYENGRRPMRLQEMRVLARELSCSVADILSDDDNPERLTVEERQLLEAFRSSPATAKQFLLTSATAVAEGNDQSPRKSAA